MPRRRLPLDLTKERPCRFGFRWRGIPFAATVLLDAGDRYLQVDADLGVVPFTLEDPARRQALLALRGRQRVGYFAVDCHGRLHQHAELRLAEPGDAGALVTALVTLLLVAWPAYDEIGAVAA